VIGARFEYCAPASAAEAVELLAADPDAGRLLGGGTWVVPELSRGDSRPRRIIDLRRAGLGAIERAGSGLRIGATVTYADLLASPLVAELAPMLHVVAAAVTGGWTIRNQGTAGGAVAAARPQSDLPAALVACGARAVVRDHAGERSVPVIELFAGPMRTALGPAEVLTALELPGLTADRTGHGYAKLRRGAGSWPIATAAATVTLADGRPSDVMLALGAVAATPLLVDVSEVLAAGQSGPEALSDAALSHAARIAGEAVREPFADELAPAEYRAMVAGPIARRALERAFEDARRRS
jgi:carbon-monoxide dehydrogenase medium subunit